MKKENRNSNFELLRIFSMFLIVLSHVVLYGVKRGNFPSWSGYGEWLSLSYAKLFSVQLLGIGGGVGVSLFFILTGYFCLNISCVKIEKIVSLYATVLFYGVCLFIFYCTTNLSFPDLSIKNCLIKNIFIPFQSNQWWFFTAYVFLVIMMPGINNILRMFSEKQFITLLVFGAMYFGFIPSYISVPFEGMTTAILYYAIGFFLRKFHYCEKLNKLNSYNKYLTVMCSILLWISFGFVITCTLNIRNESISRIINAFAYGILRTFIAILVFMVFSWFPIKNSKVINTIASTTFGVYIVHVSEIYKTGLFNNGFDVLERMYAPGWLINLVAISLIVFVSLALLDLLRQMLFKILLFKIKTR